MKKKNRIYKTMSYTFEFTENDNVFCIKCTDNFSPDKGDWVVFESNNEIETMRRYNRLRYLFNIEKKKKICFM